MGHGSQLVYSSQSLSWNVFRAAQASRMATTSAWAVGSLQTVTKLLPRPTTCPFRTTTAPKGPPCLVRRTFMERPMASLMKVWCGVMTGSYRGRRGSLTRANLVYLTYQWSFAFYGLSQHPVYVSYEFRCATSTVSCRGGQSDPRSGIRWAPSHGPAAIGSDGTGQQP